MRSEEPGRKQTALYQLARVPPTTVTATKQSSLSPSSPPPAIMKSPASIPSTAKRKQSDSQQDNIDTGELQEKRKKKYKSEEEEIGVSTPAASNTDMNSKKKEKKKKKEKERKEQEENGMHIIPEDSVTETKKKKKQKEILCEESVDTETADQQVGEADSVLMVVSPGKKKKNKKKRTQEQDEEEIHDVPEESGLETTDQHTGETDSGLPLGMNKGKKKRKQQEQGEEEIHVVQEESGTETKKRKKQKQTLCEESVEPETADQHEGETDSGLSGINKKKKKKKKRRKEKEEMHAVEEDSANEDTHHAVLAETDNVKKKKKKKKRKLVQEVEEMHAVEQQNNTKSVVSVETRVKAKKIKKGKKESNAKSISKGRTKKVKGNDVTTKSTGGEKRAVQEKSRQTDSAADYVFDSELLDELEDFIPDARKLSDSRIQRLIRLDLPRFRQFKKEGIPIRKGRFSEEENQRIRRNIEDFQTLIGISSTEKLVFPDRFKEEAQEIKKLRLQHHYVERIAEGIPRSCDQVNTRARKIFDDGNRKGRFSDEEVKTLVKLQNYHGNNWKKISEIMGRSTYSLEKRFSTQTPSHGAWQDDEVSRLKKALRDHLEDLLQQDPESSGLSREQLCDNLPWTVISQKVKTRHWTQCRLKWFSLLKTKLGRAGNSAFKRGSKGIQAKIKLIDTLYNMGVEDQAEVDWHEVAKALGHSTPVCIQKTFLRLKRSRVPHWSHMSFGEIIDFLHEALVPSMKENLHDDHDSDEEEEQQEERQERLYQLSDIFGSLDGEEFEELDNS